MFGSYRINGEKDAVPRLSLKFDKGVLNLYTCSVKFIDEPLDEVYDWSADIMSDEWEPKNARKKLKSNPGLYACDALLDQNIFAGSGNIIKNEVLFRIKMHPLSIIGALPTAKLTRLITEARNYAFDFLRWKKEFELKKHWLAYNQKICPRDNNPLIKKHLGVNNRRTFYCEKCQKLYS